MHFDYRRRPRGSRLRCVSMRTGQRLTSRVYTEDVPKLSEPRSFPLTEAVNGAIWYPSATATVPETLCFITSTRDTPVHLIDGVDGRVRWGNDLTS